MFQRKHISQPQASFCPKGNIFIPLLMEQISNQNMYSKIMEAMQCQHIMLPSAFPRAGNQQSTLSDGTESQGRCRNGTLDEGRGASKDDTAVLILFGYSRQCLEKSF